MFVHGAVGDYRAWGIFEASISRKYRFISYSQRLYGSQVWPDDPAKVGTEQYADDLIRFIEALNLGPVHLVTWSFGGKVGSLMAADRSDLLKSAIHFEPVNRELGTEPEIIAARKEFARGFSPAIKAIKKSDTLGAAKRFIEAVFGQEVGAFEFENIGFQRMVLQNAQHFGQQFLSPKSPLSTPMLTCDYLNRTRTPTLIIYGEKTNEFFRLLFEKTLKCIPNSQRAIMPGVTHAGPMRTPDVFLRLVEQWVDRHSR